MTRFVLGGLLVWLVSPGCADADRDLPRAYRRVALPAQFDAADTRARGGRLFREHCALCHGQRGDGRGPRREGLTQAPRDFTNAAWRTSTSPRRVFYAIREGIPHSSMPGWKALTEQDAWDLTAYLLSLGAPS
ncbi:MAG: cytochrome c [Acidobacteria bacterium]|nr:cytochrome c [Acidobacteriota bacterium]